MPRALTGCWPPNKVPTGETEPIERLFPNPQAARLSEHALDDVFGDLVRNSRGRAVVSVIGKSQRLDIVVGPNYRSVVVWSPKPAEFICVEPMAGVTDPSIWRTRACMESCKASHPAARGARVSG